MMQQGVQSTAIINPKPPIISHNKKNMNNHIVGMETNSTAGSRNNVPRSLDRYAVGDNNTNPTS